VLDVRAEQEGAVDVEEQEHGPDRQP